jgi:L,D-transpeptidase catalytic domain
MKLVPLFPDQATVDDRKRRRRRMRVAVLALVALACIAIGAVVALEQLWPAPGIVPGGAALGNVRLASLGEHVTSVTAVDAAGQPVPVELRAGTIVPTVRLRAAERIHLTVTVHRSGWVGWAAGDWEQIHAVVRTPATYLTGRLVYPKKGGAVEVRFSAPVRVLSVRTEGKPHVVVLRRARRTVPIGVVARGADLAGTAWVAGASRSWEQLPKAARINWFPAGPAPKVLVRPGLGTAIVPSTQLVLVFNRKLADILGSDRPVLSPRTAGTWREPNDHTLVFDPSGLGFPIGEAIHVRLPTAMTVISGADPATSRTLTWQVPGATTLRLKQLFAELGYLPLTWKPAGTGVALTPSAQANAVVEPPPGSFAWRYTKTPAALQGLWTSTSSRTVMIEGAVMAFESTHGLPLYHYATRALWQALLRDVLAGRRAPNGYSYVYVSETLPETLTLWHDGRVILRASVNTGISERPTNLGTFPVYLHLTSTTMSGINPDGTPYNDPGVPWVNYFSGGDAVHGFIRPGYGYPQSLGCVEAPYSTAEEIFPYVQVGTLVTVVPAI